MNGIDTSQSPKVPAPAVATRTPKRVMTVRVFWNDILHQVDEISLDAAQTARFTIGEDPKSDFIVPGEYLGQRDKFALAIVSQGILSVAYMSHMPTCVLRSDLEPEAWHRDPPATAEAAFEPKNHVVSNGETVKVRLGPFRFEILLEEKAPRIHAPISLDRYAGCFLGFSMALHLIVLGIFYLVPPEAAGFSFDPPKENSRFLKVMLGAQEATEATITDTLPETRAPEAAAGRVHAGPSGQMGDRTATRTQHRSGIKGPAHNPIPRLQREILKSDVQNSGIIALLSARKAPVSPFALNTASGTDPEDALGQLLGDRIGPNFGLDGLRVKGAGRGGGNDGSGAIGAGGFGRIAFSRLRGTCTARYCGAGLADGSLSGRRKTGIRLHPEPATVLGSLSKEIIRRIVRRHINEIKFCYERALQKQPDLSGRVAVKFLIEGSGAVKTAVVVDSTMANAGVDRCIAAAVRRMVFPSPENGGIVIVTYPFSLMSSAG